MPKGFALRKRISFFPFNDKTETKAKTYLELQAHFLVCKCHKGKVIEDIKVKLDIYLLGQALKDDDNLICFFL